MKDVEHDLMIARTVLEDYDDYYDVEPDRLYLRSNEPLDFIFPHLDVQGKDVLSVLASSDQVLSFYYTGAKKVDSFDVHPLAEYYYYLRKWSIEQGQGPYPYNCNNFDLRQLLKKVNPRFEEEDNSIKFWSTLLDEIPGLMYSSLFFSAFLAGKTPYQGKEEELRDCVPSTPLTFYNQNIFHPFTLDSTYDIIYASNILENAHGNITRLEICRDNLDRLLNSDGIVVSSRVMREVDDSSFARERDVFSEKFHYTQGEERYNSASGRKASPYYVYQKK